MDWPHKGPPAPQSQRLPLADLTCFPIFPWRTQHLMFWNLFFTCAQQWLFLQFGERFCRKKFCSWGKVAVVPEFPAQCHSQNGSLISLASTPEFERPRAPLQRTWLGTGGWTCSKCPLWKENSLKLHTFKVKKGEASWKPLDWGSG